jgi:hypothetical protein
MILMIKNIFTYLQYIQKYIYTIHIYIDLFTSRVEGLGHWNTMIRYLTRENNDFPRIFMDIPILPQYEIAQNRSVSV